MHPTNTALNSSAADAADADVEREDEEDEKELGESMFMPQDGSSNRWMDRGAIENKSKT